MTPANSNNETRASEVSPQVERLGKQFVTAWMLNHEQRIEPFLEDVPEELRNEAHDMLIRLEVYIRASHGESLMQDEYHKRFPDYELEIEHAFRPDTQSVSAGMRSTSSARGSYTSMMGDSADISGFQMATRFDVIPERVGRYKIESTLGTGGFGVVCLARDSELDRLVALKFARTSRFRNKQEMKQLVSEARTAAQLEHPGIVAVHDVIVEGELVAIIQQYIEGRELAAEIKANPPTFERTAELMIGVCNAIAFAHTKGFVHRDLKPANILINENGDPHIADFGLAIHESFQRRRRGDQSGTPRYMSPELVRGESHRIDGRSDIWSIGVMLYGMLTGKLPFQGETRAELFDEIKNREPKPLRQIRSDVPVELERICLKCLQKAVSKRFATATDIAEDLKSWLQEASLSQSELETSSGHFAEVVPKGLRSFDAEDADFFLRLLPGPFARNGLPESIRFWKSRIEKRDSDMLEIGLLYGPSGCGKSSFVKAGLIPHLAPFVKAVRIEATGADTEVRLIKALRTRYRKIPTGLTLPQLFHGLREGEWSTGGDRILVVIDQFEQWLHNRSSYPNTELVEALRHCDGQQLQCLLMVRDDFWLATSRFLKALEVELVEGKNAGLVDLFDKPHARKVLQRYGHGYDCLDDQLTKQQEEFIELAVDELAEEDRIICVRLSLFAEMFKDKAWTPVSLRRAGGISGVGVAFLDDTFTSKNASPEHRLYEEAARNILGALLPETTVDIRGNMRSRHELLHISGYANRPNAFSDVLRILDKELRLITPTDPEGIGSNVDTDPASEKDYYQLTHDYLVAPLRIWLYQKQRETARGRARLRLDERHATWSRTRESRFLPSLGEYLNIRSMTRSSAWSEGERKMMRKSDRRYGLRFAMVFGLLLATGLFWRGWYTSMRADTLANRIVEAETAEVPEIVAEVNESGLRDQVTIRLRDVDVGGDERQQLNIDLALAHLPEYRQKLWQRINENARVDDIQYIANAITPEKHEAEALWSELRKPRDVSVDGKRLQAAATLSHWAADDSRWQDVNYSVADILLDQGSYFSIKWTEAMSAVHEQLFRGFILHLAEWRIEAIDQRDPEIAVSLLQDYQASWPEIREHLEQLIRDFDFQSTSAGDPQVRRKDYEDQAQMQANMAAVLAALGSLDPVLPLLDLQSGERTRDLLIDQFTRFRVSGQRLFECVRAEPTRSNPEICTALWLALGNYVTADSPAFNEWLLSAREEFTKHSDARVHNACKWLLDKSGQQDWIETTEQQLANSQSDSRQSGQSWRITREGHTMLKITAPGQFVMSHQRPAQIDYDYEVSSMEINWKQWISYTNGFRRDFVELIEAQDIPDDNEMRPVTDIKWFDAAHYCNWMSQQEGLQCCYEAVPGPASKRTTYLTWGAVNEEIRLAKLRLVSDYRTKDGYRLPLESEWEWLDLLMCCSPDPNGHSDQFRKLFERRDWCYVEARDGEYPRIGGLKMPGRFGTFDLFGNVIEFCSDPYGAFKQQGALPRIAANSPYRDPVEFVARKRQSPEFDSTKLDSKEFDLRELDSSKLSKGVPLYSSDLTNHRHPGLPTASANYSGFRIVRILPEQSSGN